MNTGAKLAVVGTRTFDDYKLLCSILDLMPLPGCIISGGATGADSLAERYASEHNIPFICFNADWKTYGKRAGPMRNKQIVHSATELVAFWDFKSSGTKNSIEEARKARVPVRIIDIRK